MKIAFGVAMVATFAAPWIVQAFQMLAEIGDTLASVNTLIGG